jgi:hypothetical protein
VRVAQQQTPSCAIVGSGLAALAAYATLRHEGVAAEEIAVFGTHADPTVVWRRRAESIRQRRMRSESDGHLAAAAFPGLAVREALRRRSPAPLVATATNRYHPTVVDFLAHADRVRDRSGWSSSFHERRVERVRAVDTGSNGTGFELDGEGPFRHVLVAGGHPGLALPEDARGRPGVVHAYEPHEYAARVTVVGAGMAAATEWLNALAAGAEVVSVRRREPLRRALNVPRPLFSKRGLAAFHASTHERRAARLRELSTPSYPAGPAWDEPIDEAIREGRFQVRPTLDDGNGANRGPGVRHVPDTGQTRARDVPETCLTRNGAEQVICATGFLRGYWRDSLLARLVDDHGLETHDRWIVLAPDSTVPALTDDDRTFSLAGVHAQWAFPAADTIAGAKYAARAFSRRVCRTR